VQAGFTGFFKIEHAILLILKNPVNPVNPVYLSSPSGGNP
jgi:hypothetical protein